MTTVRLLSDVANVEAECHILVFHSSEKLHFAMHTQKTSYRMDQNWRGYRNNVLKLCWITFDTRASAEGLASDRACLRQCIHKSIPHVADVTCILSLQLEDALNDRHLCCCCVDTREGAPIVDDHTSSNNI